MRKLSRWIPVVAGAVAGGIIALVIAGSSGSTKHVTTTVVTPEQTSSEPASFSSSGGMTINQIYREASPGVVDILVKSSGGALSEGAEEAEGAGVVYDTKGDILTDEHVVKGATSVEVTFSDGKQVPAKVLGTDPSTDVGVIHVDVPASELHPIPFANSDSAQVGDSVVAIGSPFALPETVTTGIVSQTGRPIEAPNNYTIPGAIQTDAAINPGNSGGPLLNASDQVLGLNDQIETNNTTVGGEGSSSGVGFATPGNEDVKVANEIIAGTKVEHSYLGVDLVASSVGGAKVQSVQPDSPASKAMLQAGDLITAVNGTAVTSTEAVTATDQLIATVFGYDPGQTITLTIKRSGTTKQVKITLGVRPANAPSAG